MTDVLQDIINLLTGGITSIATGIGSGLKSLVEAIFLDTSAADGTALSTFGSLIIVFAGISLAIGLCRWVMNFVTSLGASA